MSSDIFREKVRVCVRTSNMKNIEMPPALKRSVVIASRHSTAILSLSFNHKGSLLAACHEDGLIDLVGTKLFGHLQSYEYDLLAFLLFKKSGEQIDTYTCEIVETIEKTADESEHHKSSQPHIITFNPKYDLLAFSSDQRDGSIFLHEPYGEN